MNRKLLIVIVLSLIGQIVYSQSCTNCGGTTVIGTNASAIGTNTVANGHSTFASGFASQATQPYTTAIGFYSFANYTKAISLGSMVKSNTYRAVVIGSGGEQSTNIFLQNNIPNSLMIGFSSQYPTLFVSESESSVNYDKTGMVGIGNVTDPQAKLHILADEGEEATILLETRNWDDGESSSLFLGSSESGITANSSNGMTFHSEGNYIFNSGGKVGINTTNFVGDYSLYVENGIITDEVMVKHPTQWYDNVFEEDYKLRSIHDLNNFIKLNKHLPDIPAEKDVKKNGINLGEMDALLLKKIEELTIYIIQLEKKVESQQKAIDKLNSY